MSSNQILDCAQTLLISFFILYTFHKILECKKHSILSILLFMIIQITSYYLLCYSPYVTNSLTEDIRMLLKTIFTVTILLVFVLFFCNANIIKKIQAFLVVNLAIFFSEAIQTIFYVTLLDISSSEMRSIDFQMRLIIGSIAVFFYIGACLLSFFICKHKDLNLPPKIFGIFATIFLSIAFLFSLVTSSSVYSKSLMTTLITITSIFITTFLIVVLYKLMLKMNEQEILKEKLFWSENIQKIQFDYYNNIKEKTNELREIRHDIRDHLSTINQLVSKNSPNAIEIANSILSDLNNKFSSKNLPVFTENIIVNTIMTVKYEEFTNENIKWDIKLDLPIEITSIENIDLHCLFINLLNNAIEASLKLDVNQRFIKLSSTVKSNHLIIKTENAFKDVKTDKNGKLLTSKPNKSQHGIGTILIENIVKKYNGNYEISIVDNTFKSTIIIEC